MLPEPGRPFAAYMVVRQTFLRLQMELLTDRTRSMLMGEHLAWNEESDSYTVWAVYECKPVGIQDEGNLYHLGAFKLGPGRRDAAKWDGTYFMDAELLIDRDKRIVTRQGAIHLIERRHKEYDSYAHAEKAFTRLRRRMPGAVLSLDPPVVTGQQV